MICKTCGHSVAGGESELVAHLVVAHSIERPVGFASWDEARDLQVAMGKLIEQYYDRGFGDGAGVREPRRPKPKEPTVSASV